MKTGIKFPRIFLCRFFQLGNSSYRNQYLVILLKRNAYKLLSKQSHVFYIHTKDKGWASFEPMKYKTRNIECEWKCESIFSCFHKNFLIFQKVCPFWRHFESFKRNRFLISTTMITTPSLHDLIQTDNHKINNICTFLWWKGKMSAI